MSDPMQNAIRNLAHWVERYTTENVGQATPPVVVAAQHLLAVAKAEATPDVKVGDRVSFAWQQHGRRYSGEVVDRIQFGERIRLGVRVMGPTRIDPNGINGGRVYDVWTHLADVQLIAPEEGKSK